MNDLAQTMRLEMALSDRKTSVSVIHHCGHRVDHAVVGIYGLTAFIIREQNRVCTSCAKVKLEAQNQLRIEAKKASLREEMEVLFIWLAALEILQSTDGELPALELMTQVINCINNYHRDAYQLCDKLGLARDEMVRVERFL